MHPTLVNDGFFFFKVQELFNSRSSVILFLFYSNSIIAVLSAYLFSFSVLHSLIICHVCQRIRSVYFTTQAESLDCYFTVIMLRVVRIHVALVLAIHCELVSFTFLAWGPYLQTFRFTFLKPVYVDIEISWNSEGRVGGRESSPSSVQVGFPIVSIKDGCDWFWTFMF